MTVTNTDVAHAAESLAARIPAPLSGLARLAYNYRWSWMAGGAEVFRSIDPMRWDFCAANPVRLLQEADTAALQRAAEDPAMIARIAELNESLDAYLARPAAPGPVTADNPVAFLCAEFAVHQSLPIYSGGLGALAGDILKQASDQALPLVAVGLLYSQGYFRQRIDASGWQHEYWVPTDPVRTPAVLVRGEDGEPLTITVPISDRDVVARIWRVDVGRVPMFLLDTDVPENDGRARWITARLYVGDPEVRLEQYALLGVGGVRALKLLGIDPGVVHLNEGHAAFATLELAHDRIKAGESVDAALAAVRDKVVFTSHTPVAAGNDTYPTDQVAATLGTTATEVGMNIDEIIALGRLNPDDHGAPFGVTELALRTSRNANGVSRRHGEVARGMWQPLWTERPVEDVPIGHVTNGVHIPTWLGEPMRRLLDSHLGEGWMDRATDPGTWDALDSISDADLWAARCEQRAGLVEYVRESTVRNRLTRGEPRHLVEAGATAFDPDALTIGFARRLATYKRLWLLGMDRARSIALMAGDRPIQLVIAGKAHPRDESAKHVLQDLFSSKDATPEITRRVVVLDDYDLGMAAHLVRGCDVWLNVPRPPLEASGTSGMKSAVNGGLNLSVLDGWWAEGYDGTNGWAIPGEVSYDHAGQDVHDAAELYRLLEEDVLDEFYDRGPDGIPARWIARVRASLRTLSPEFGAGRMIDDYAERVYSR